MLCMNMQLICLCIWILHFHFLVSFLEKPFYEAICSLEVNRVGLAVSPVYRRNSRVESVLMMKFVDEALPEAFRPSFETQNSAFLFVTIKVMS